MIGTHSEKDIESLRAGDLVRDSITNQQTIKGRVDKEIIIIIIIITRMLLLQATVKRFQFDLYVNLEGQQMLISSWFQK